MKEYKRITGKDAWSGCVTFSNATSKDEIFERLCELEDKIEDGTLIELHCKVGDVVYQFDNGGEIYELLVLSITIYKNKLYYETIGVDFDNTAIGKTVFLTKAEAEKKLLELKGVGEEYENN